jgi:Glycosyl hydrolase family 26
VAVSFTELVVTATYEAPDGSTPTGSVTFTPTSEMIQSDLIIPALARVAQLGNNAPAGQISISLYANNDPETEPEGVGYTVTEEITRQGVVTTRTYIVILPYTAYPTVDLSTLAPVTTEILYGYDLAGAAAAAQTAAEEFASLIVADETTRAEAAEAAVQTTAESFATSAVATETSRAEAAEATKLPLAGGTMSGVLNLGGLVATAGGTPVNPTDIPNKAYVDAAATGLSVKAAATVVAVSNIASLSGATTIDSVSCPAGTRVLLIGQSTASQNGLWTVETGAWSRPSDFAHGATEQNTYVAVLEGTVYGGTSWYMTTEAVTVDTTAETWVQFASVTAISAGTGITVVGNQINVTADTYDAYGAAAAETSRAEAAEALLAPLASPSLTGSPTAPTKSPLTDSTDIATTAYTDAAVAVEKSRAETAEALLAPLASPALTGSPTAPTKSPLTDSTDIATTAYTDAAVAVETTRAEAAEALATSTAETYASGLVGAETTRAEAAEALLAPKASPALTGTPTAPTAAPLTDDTQVATTGYADAAVAVETTRALAAETTVTSGARRLAASNLLIPASGAWFGAYPGSNNSYPNAGAIVGGSGLSWTLSTTEPIESGTIEVTVNGDLVSFAYNATASTIASDIATATGLTVAGSGGPLSSGTTVTLTFTGTGPSTFVVTAGASFESSVAGRELDIFSAYYALDELFPNATEQALCAAGRYMSVDWSTQLHYTGGYAQWEDVANGVYDDLIIAEANYLAAWGQPIIIGFGNECDSPTWIADSGAISGGGPNSMQYFPAAYQHIVNLVRPIAPNVVWAWVTTGSYLNSTTAAAYPGDEYVDWIGFDPYDPTLLHGSPSASYSPSMAWLAALATGSGVTVTGLSANEIELVAYGLTSGTISLSVNGTPVTGIAYNASASTVESAINTALGAGTVTASSGGALGTNPVSLTFATKPTSFTVTSPTPVAPVMVGKPVIINETGVIQPNPTYPTDAARATWIDAVPAYLESLTGPQRICAWIWFNASGGLGNTEIVAPANPLSAAAFANIGANAYFNQPHIGNTGVGGDLSGTVKDATVASIQGTAIGAPPGGTTEFLRGDGTWEVPAGTGPALDSTSSDISASAPGNSKSAGSVGKAADSGHVHGREAWGTSGQVGTETFGVAASAGSSGAVADAAHIHAMPAIDSSSGDIGAMGFNQSATAGSVGKVADAGHKHSFPALDSTASDIAALGTQAAGSTGKAADAGHVHPTTGLLTSLTSPDSSITVSGSTVEFNPAIGLSENGLVYMTGGGTITAAALEALPSNRTGVQLDPGEVWNFVQAGSTIQSLAASPVTITGPTTTTPTITTTASSGTVTFLVNGIPIECAYNATGASIAAAINAVPGLGLPSVVASGGPNLNSGTPVTLTFQTAPLSLAAATVCTTSSAHIYQQEELVGISGATGNTTINGQWQVQATDTPTTFVIPVAYTTGYTASSATAINGLNMSGFANFKIKSEMFASIGYSGHIVTPLQGSPAEGTGYINTGSCPDGLVIYDYGTQTQGLYFEGLVFIGPNTNSCVHWAGRVRTGAMKHCFFQNTSTAGAPINGPNATTYTNNNGTVTPSQWTLLNPGPTITDVANWYPQACYGGGGAQSGFVWLACSDAPALCMWFGCTVTGIKNLIWMSGGVGTMSNGAAVTPALPAFGLLYDTQCQGVDNQEDIIFDTLSVVSNQISIGIGCYDGKQQPNDCIWQSIVTLNTGSGPASVFLNEGGDHPFKGWYDRSQPSLAPWCQMINNNGKISVDGGEDNNQLGSGSPLVSNSPLTSITTTNSSTAVTLNTTCPGQWEGQGFPIAVPNTVSVAGDVATLEITTPTSGTDTISVNSTNVSFAYNASGATIAAAINTALGAGTVTASSGANVNTGAVTLTFASAPTVTLVTPTGIVPATTSLTSFVTTSGQKSVSFPAVPSSWVGSTFPSCTGTGIPSGNGLTIATTTTGYLTANATASGTITAALTTMLVITGSGSTTTTAVLTTAATGTATFNATLTVPIYGGIEHLTLQQGTRLCRTTINDRVITPSSYCQFVLAALGGSIVIRSATSFSGGGGGVGPPATLNNTGLYSAGSGFFDLSDPTPNYSNAYLSGSGTVYLANQYVNSANAGSGVGGGPGLGTLGPLAWSGTLTYVPNTFQSLVTFEDGAAVPAGGLTVGGSPVMLPSTYDPADIAQQVVGTTATQTLTNKTLTSPQIASLTPDGTHTQTFQDATDTIVSRATTDTLTNKRYTARVLSVTNGTGTPTLDTDNYDVFEMTAQSAAITSMTTNLTGTPNDGDELRIRITDNGTSHSIVWGAKFEQGEFAGGLPGFTVPSTRMDNKFEWNAVTSAWRLVDSSFYATVGQQVAYNAVTSNYTAANPGTSAWTLADTTSGTCPSITLPNDGHTYMVQFFASDISNSDATNVSDFIGIGTSTTTIYNVSALEPTASGDAAAVNVFAQVTGTGQTIQPYVQTTGTSGTISFFCATGGSSNTHGPSFLSAVRVA